MGGIGKLDFLACVPTPLDPYHVTPSADKWAATAGPRTGCPWGVLQPGSNAHLNLLGPTSLHQLVHLAALPGL